MLQSHKELRLLINQSNKFVSRNQIDPFSTINKWIAARNMQQNFFMNDQIHKTNIF